MYGHQFGEIVFKHLGLTIEDWLIQDLHYVKIILILHNFICFIFITVSIRDKGT